jgi:hypothetical protein
MQTLTNAITGLAHTIVQLREERAEATAQRGKETQERDIAVALELDNTRAARGAAARSYHAAASASVAKLATDVDSFISLQRRNRLDHTAAQRRQLASFMSDLTATVGTMRDGFRADLGSLRVALKASADGTHRQLDAQRSDRHGADEAWHSTKPAPSKKPTVEPTQRAEPQRPAEPVVAAEPVVKAAEPAPTVTTHQPQAAPQQVSPQQVSRPSSNQQRGHGGSFNATGGGKSSS